MKFMLTYADASTVTVDIPDAEVRAWVINRARLAAEAARDAQDTKRGAAVAVAQVS